MVQVLSLGPDLCDGDGVGPGGRGDLEGYECAVVSGSARWGN